MRGSLWPADVDGATGGAESDRVGVGARLIIIAHADKHDIPLDCTLDSIRDGPEWKRAVSNLSEVARGPIDESSAASGHVEAGDIGIVGHDVELIVGEANTWAVVGHHIKPAIVDERLLAGV